MLFRSSIVFATAFALSFDLSVAVPCDFDPEVSGLGEEIFFDSATKLSISGFTASVNYVSLAIGEPYLKILSASEEPVVIKNGETLYIQTGSCDDPEEDLGESTNGSPDSESGAMTMLGGFAASIFAPRGVVPALLVASILGANLSPVLGQDADDTCGCMPTLDIEISVPAGTETTPKFGDTDHYVEANLENVVWGWYDPNATAILTAQSGETVTMEGITSVCGLDYAKTIRGDPNVEQAFGWRINETMITKSEPKLPGSGPHLVTGPVAIEGAMPGDVLQVDILEVDPRLNPESGKCYGVNMQIRNGYHYRTTNNDGVPYDTGGAGLREAFTVMEFVQDEDDNMLWGKPVYMFRFPNMTIPDGTFHNSIVDASGPYTVPHVYNYGYNLEKIEEEPVVYGEEFTGFVLEQDEIEYMSPDPAGLDWKVPLRPHMGILAVQPGNAYNWDPDNGLNTVPPARFGGNIDDWRIGKGGTMYYVVEVPGAMVYMGDTHAAQGDSELAGTAMETSLTSKLRFTLHKQDSLPKKVATLDFPLLETSTEYVIHGFAYNNYLDQLTPPQDIFAIGGTLDLAMEDCFIRTRDWLMDVYDLVEEETIALMTMGIDFGVTQVVDANWGVHSDIPKWLFDDTETPFDYSCTTSKTAGRARGRGRRLQDDVRRSLMERHGVKESPEEHAEGLYKRITKKCASCQEHPMRNGMAQKLLDAKLHHLDKAEKQDEKMRLIHENMERHFEAAKKQGLKLRR